MRRPPHVPVLLAPPSASQLEAHPFDASGPPSRPLEPASRRLRGAPGRPRTVRASSAPGLPDQGAALRPALVAGPAHDFAASLLPRGLSAKAAAGYVGVSVRDLWRRVERGELPVVRWPGHRRVVFDRHDLDGLFAPAFKEVARSTPRVVFAQARRQR